MIVNIEDRSIQELLQVCIKEEAEFLARNLLRRPEVRKYVWPAMQTQLIVALTASGLVLPKELITNLKLEAAPSGGGGGSDPGDDGGSKTGGGGGQNVAPRPPVVEPVGGGPGKDPPKPVDNKTAK